MEKRISDPLSEEILKNNILNGNSILIDFIDNIFTFTKTNSMNLENVIA